MGLVGKTQLWWAGQFSFKIGKKEGKRNVFTHNFIGERESSHLRTPTVSKKGETRRRRSNFSD